MQSANRRSAPRPLAVAVVVALIALAILPAAVARAAAPTITSISPDDGLVAGGNSVTITGTGLTGTTGVTFGGDAATDVFVVDDTTVTLITPPHAAGAVDVILTDDEGSDTLASGYTYVAAPTVTALSPDNGPVTGGTVVTITGTNFTGFTGAPTVTFGGTAATGVTVVNATTISATAPAHAAGDVQVVVTTPGGASATSAASEFTYTAVAPTVTSLSPTTGGIAGGTVVTITGTGFTGATEVNFGTIDAASFTVVDADTITATTPAHAAGIVDVTVTTPAGTSATSAASKFTYGSAAPTVTSLSPTSGPIAGGTSVTITGTNFTGVTAVTFGGTAAASYTVVSPTTITAVTPARSAGAAFVQVTTAAGASATGAASTFTYTSAPTVTSVDPAGGPLAGGNNVTITGTGFVGVAEVYFGTVEATSFAVVDADTITAVAPAGTAGTVNITVEAAGGTSATGSATQYTYSNAPVITGITPTSGTTLGGTTVTITGTGFTGITGVTFGGVAATSYTVNSPTSITAVAPAHAAGDVDIRVTNAAGTSAVTSVAEFTYEAAETVTYALSPRWTLIAWLGPDNANIEDALSGDLEEGVGNDISGQVTAIYRWDRASQSWEANFPGNEDVPGANDFTTLDYGEAYFVAISATGQIAWTVPAAPTTS